MDEAIVKVPTLLLLTVKSDWELEATKSLTGADPFQPTLPAQYCVYAYDIPLTVILLHVIAPAEDILAQLICAPVSISTWYFPTFEPDNWSCFISDGPWYTPLAKEYELKSTVKLSVVSKDKGDAVVLIQSI